MTRTYKETLVRFQRCADCPHMDTHGEPDSPKRITVCNFAAKKIENIRAKIPEWCPIPDTLVDDGE